MRTQQAAFSNDAIENVTKLIGQEAGLSYLREFAAKGFSRELKRRWKVSVAHLADVKDDQVPTRSDMHPVRLNFPYHTPSPPSPF